MNTRIQRFLCVAAILTGVSAQRAVAQDGGQADEIKAKELQAKIRKEMGEIDELLLQAAKDAPKDAAARIEQVKADLDKLLKDIQSKQSQAVTDIEELVRMAKRQSNSGGKGSGEPDPKNSPQQKQQDERGKDPEVDKLKQQGEKDKGEGKQKPEEKSGQPKDGGPDKSKPDQQKADGVDPPSEKEKYQRENVAGRWGVLPPKVQEMFQKLSQNEFPDRYRELLLQYYRTRNKSKQP